jgi:hypothetical protein
VNKFIERISVQFPPAVARFMPAGLSFLAGVFIAIVFHYVLYRVGLPSKPFIYVAF